MGCHEYYGYGGIVHDHPMNSENCPTTRNLTSEAHRHHRRRRKRLPPISKVILLSCIVVVASSNGEPEPEEECKEPQAANLKFSLEHKPIPTNRNSPSPGDTPQLGDGIRSAEASGIFFDSLDTDGDGAIEPDEVALFLQNEIGGKQFDTQSEVDEEVGTIMERLDQNHNNGLEMSDMLNYWMQLESLLTAEEVSEWIVYSVQLPSSIGKIFLENGITGYDFLEIVDNGGDVLQNELGIDKASFRNKIVRQMQSRMLGIGSAPQTPKKFSFELESCKAVSLSWERSIARVFPVHSYRIQRRAINLFGGQTSNDSTAAVENLNIFDSSSMTNSDWKTVYVGGDNEFVDSGLEYGHNYMYRIQAWNAIGRSIWESLSLTKALKKQKCSTKPSQPVLVADRGIPTHQDVGTDWEWMSTPKRVMWGAVAFVQCLYTSVRVFFSFIALFAGMMRFRRATATSSASAQTVLPFPWFWNKFNRLSKKLVGQELIPRTMLGDREALIRQEQLHDERIMATGLRGYNRLRNKAASDASDRDDRVGDLHSTDRRSALKKVKSYSTGDLTAYSVTFGPPKEVVIPGTTPRKFAWMLPNANKQNTISFEGAISEGGESSYTPTLRSRGSSMSKSDHPRDRSDYVDDGSRCSECHKKFRIGKRYKHHCCRCMATFCHRHGKTSHSNFTSCKVPGDCMCNSCLRLKSSRGASSDERSRQSRFSDH
mmetsp:Transcript_6298/g.15661  ORF Transcript_6298/g.15661 Transcript_6298/m.15661 type:complete len:711 (+) Transcript_6298:212-2344(+)